MHILKTNFNGTPNVGLYGYATQRYLLLGERLTEKLEKEVRDALGGIEVRTMRVAGTGMPGLFLAGNSKAVLVPSIAFPQELKILRDLGIPYEVIETSQTCLGNNIACNDHGAIVSTDFSERECKRIGQALGVPVVRLDIAGLTTPGAFIVLNGDKGIVHRNASEAEVAAIEEALKVTLSPATVNLGTPYLHAAILGNAHGFVIGDASGGPEIVHVDDALGYLGGDE